MGGDYPCSTSKKNNLHASRKRMDYKTRPSIKSWKICMGSYGSAPIPASAAWIPFLISSGILQVIMVFRTATLFMNRVYDWPEAKYCLEGWKGSTISTLGGLPLTTMFRRFF